MHGGEPNVVAGKRLDPVYVDENLGMLERGCVNMQHHIRIALMFSATVVGVVNVFVTDRLVRGGKGAKNLGRAVNTYCKKMRTQGSQFKFLYSLKFTIAEKFKVIYKDTYGANGVEFSEEAKIELGQRRRSLGALDDLSPHSRPLDIETGKVIGLFLKNESTQDREQRTMGGMSWPYVKFMSSRQPFYSLI
ncbi:unnamed protein product [Peronospora destructor]|uniref:Uncharacterized protein n=1 Tax=Peronospora destructor TaxID=86335 RepID=A0AAV0U3K5_9STRA|nr:unnamed protein product [Peronospora destructor]